jgi:hypothetical protein
MILPPQENPRMRALAALVALVAVSACQTPCPATPTGPVNARFACEDGSTLAVTFTYSPDIARVSQEGYTTVELPLRLAGASYRYADGGAELRRRGTETRWTRPGAAETVCSEVTAP